MPRADDPRPASSTPWNPYSVLGVAPDATTDEVRRAYRALARQFHPDVSRARDAEQRFREINTAYELLIDPSKRRAFDEAAAKLVQPEAPGGGVMPHYSWTNIADRGARSGDGMSDFDDIYETFFASRAGEQDTAAKPKRKRRT